jgi:class 3 adenylate cyclase
MALRDAGTITDREVVKRQEEVMQGTYRWNWFRFRQYYISLVFTDIQGSTRLWERFGPKFKTIIDMHHRVLRTVLKRHHGYEVGLMINCMCSSFLDLIMH